MAASQTDQGRDELLDARISLRIAELRLLAAWTSLRFERLREAERGRLPSADQARRAAGARTLRRPR